MAGLLTARVLSDHFAEVTVLERDVLPDRPASRRGVGQDRHAHGLLASGHAVIDRLFPGITAELVAEGAETGDIARDFHWYQYGGWKLQEPIGCEGVVTSRPILEHAVRTRVKAVANIRFVENVDIEAPVFDSATSRVTGVTYTERGTATQRQAEADLVVDCTGRGSQSGKWLEAWGYVRPTETKVTIDIGYSSMVVSRRPGDLRAPLGVAIAMEPPHGTRGSAVCLAHSGEWVVTLAGALGDYPPNDREGFLEFARSLPDPCVYDLVRNAETTSEVVQARYPANLRRHYEGLKQFPGGYLVLGDAICSFNPVFGQGMSVSAMEAMALDACLRDNDEQLARAFFKRAKRIVDVPWTIATGEDMRFPQVEGKRQPGAGLVNAYMDRVHRAAMTDPVVCRRFFDVLNLMRSPMSVFAPHVAWRVMRSGGKKAARGATVSSGALERA